MLDEKHVRGMEVVALSLFDQSTEPVGSPRLVTAFRAEGIDVAEATAGRFLRAMDERGLTTRVGRQGRLITEWGRTRLQHLLLVERLDVQSSELVRILSASDTETLTDILRLRRAVEGEAAGLAALRATGDECRQLKEIADRHHHHVLTDQEGMADALDFHLAVARASHSPIVLAVVALLIEPANDPFMKVLDIITLDAGAQFQFAHEHDAVADAILNRDPQVAEFAMRQHVDALANLVEQFLAGGATPATP